MPVDVEQLIETEALGKVSVKVAVEELVAPGFCAPKDWQSAAPDTTYAGLKAPVQWHPEIARIIGLPRRDPVDPRSAKARALTRLFTQRLAKPDDGASCDCESKHKRPCIRELRAIQAIALYELRIAGGFVGSIAVGAGKTVLDLLAPLVMPNCKTAVLLVPPKLINPQLISNYEQISNHFRVPSLSVFGSTYYKHVEGAPMLYVLPYSLLSREHYTAKLNELQPDLIIADEVQNLRNADSVRTGRLLWYKHHHPRARYVCWSGSLSNKRVQDYGVHMAMALGTGSPAPQGEKAPEVLEDMARAINPSDYPAPPGPLVALCPPDGEMPELKGQDRLWFGWRKRLQETEGVVFTHEASIDAEVVIEERKAPTLPAVIRGHLRKLREDWIRPDGEELVDALSVARTARQLACGFHLYWYFPPIKGVEQEVETILDWLDARKWWRKEIREELKKHTPHMDSPLLLTRAAMRHHGDLPIRDVVDVLDENGIKVGEQASPDLPVWESECWPRWRDTRSKVVFETRCQRIDPFLAQHVATLALAEKQVVWYQSRAFGQWIAEFSGLPTFGAGTAVELHKHLAEHGGSKSMICSMKAHGTGTDGFQYHFDRMLITEPPSSGEAWAQTVGREHRPGQKSDTVTAGVFRHTKEMADAVDDAVTAGHYQHGTLGAVHPLVEGNELSSMPQAWDEDDYDEDE